MAPRNIEQATTAPKTMDSVDSSKKTTPPTDGCFLRWSRLTKIVSVQDGGGGLMGRQSISRSLHAESTAFNRAAEKSKKILNSVSGYAAPGQVLACMGPSGAGKTTLMNVLSGRSSYQDGVLSINGSPATPKTMKRLMSKVAYVKQQDIFFNHLTVRDQLTYTALLRMPSDKTTEEKHQEVDKLIRLLRLSKVADSQIMMVSGGERKRVNIATELLTDPEVLLLDEPTSGLDSTTAVALIHLLQQYAQQQGKTVITTIHQPTSAVFRSFDRLILLSDGYVVYFGDPVGSIEYLKKVDLACPDGYNAADHWMDLLVVDSGVQEEEEDANADIVDVDEEKGARDSLLGPSQRASIMIDGTKSHLKLQKEWDGDAIARQMDDTLVESSDDKSLDGMMTLPSNGSKYNTGWWTQYSILVHRALKNSRSAILTPLNLMKSIGLGLASGLIYWQTDYTEAEVQDIRGEHAKCCFWSLLPPACLQFQCVPSGLFFFTMTFWVFDAMFTALASFPEERIVIQKERSSGSYHLSAYFMAKTTSDMPVRVLLPLTYMVISYWMANIDSRFKIFVGSVGCALLSVVAGEAIGLCLGASVYDLQRAITVMTVGALFLMLVGGFFAENPPAWIDWGTCLMSRHALLRPFPPLTTDSHCCMIHSKISLALQVFLRFELAAYFFTRCTL